MDFKVIKYYDICCDRCGNWATSDISARDLECRNKSEANKVLYGVGWRIINGEVLCNYCVTGKTRFIIES